jgi:hypothetical protein
VYSTRCEIIAAGTAMIQSGNVGIKIIGPWSLDYLHNAFVMIDNSSVTAVAEKLNSFFAQKLERKR